MRRKFLPILPEVFPLHVRLLEHPVVGVDHPRPEDAEQHDDHRELVEGPQGVPCHVGDALLDVPLVVSPGAGADHAGRKTPAAVLSVSGVPLLCPLDNVSQAADVVDGGGVGHEDVGELRVARADHGPEEVLERRLVVVEEVGPIVRVHLQFIASYETEIGLWKRACVPCTRRQ